MKPEQYEALLGALRALEREEAGDALAEARWERVAAGTATAEDLAEIEREEAGDAPARELLAPLGPAAEERYAKAIEAEVAAQRAAAPVVGAPTISPTAPAISAAEAIAAPAVSPRAPVIALARRRGARVAAACAALAMAAALALALRSGTPGQALPAYELSLTGGEAFERGEPSPERLRIARGSRVVLALRPSTPAAGPLEARAFVVQGGKATPLELSVRVSPDGALRLSGSVGAEAPLVPGDAEIAAVVGRPGTLGAAGEAALVEGEGRRVLRRAVRVIERP
jgi:hypothetical protein